MEIRQNQFKKIIFAIALLMFFGNVNKENSSIIVILVIVGVFWFLNKKHGIFNNFKFNKNNNMETYQTVKAGGKRFIGYIIGLVVLLLLITQMIIVIPAGKTGVYSIFGKVKEQELSSGIHFINPFAQVTLMSIRTEEYTMSIASAEGRRTGDDSITALTKEGLTITLDVTVLYRLVEEKASDVFLDLGITYDEKVIRPEIRSAIREVVAVYEAKETYSEKREEITTQISSKLSQAINPRGITVESLLLRNVHLPEKLKVSIQEKLSAEQESQKYDFVLQKEAKEAERKIIEAEGQKSAQIIIAEGLTIRMSSKVR